MSRGEKSHQNFEFSLLLGRFLTRSGDQAWDFIIPFALLHLFPGKIQVAALYYLVIKIGTLSLAPFIGRWIDSNQRMHVLKAGMWTQFFGVLGGIFCFYFLDVSIHNAAATQDLFLYFCLLAIFGTIASIGSFVTEISIGNDLAPSLVPVERLTDFNSWLRRIDLGTEVISPIIAGLLFAIELSNIHLFGLFVIAFWNLLSFVPELLLLSKVLKKSNLKEKAISTVPSWKMIFGVHLKSALKNPIFLLISSYAFLWLSVLSPHGVLLAGYLKDGFRLPESEIGLFRGLGAVFGLLSTLTFPFFVKKYSLTASSRLHLGFQFLVLAFGTIAFSTGAIWGLYFFMGCILLSRIGLYGFSNGEFEFRQRLIPEQQRGELNSLSYSMTTLASLLLLLLGSLLPSTGDFRILIYISVAAVFLANILFHLWVRRSRVCSDFKTGTAL